MSRRFRFRHGSGSLLDRAEVFNDVSNHAQCLVFVLCEMVGHARLSGVDVRTPQLFGRDLLSGCGLYERWPSEKDRSVALDDDGFVRHGGHVGSTSGARTQNSGDLRDSVARHPCLVAEDAAEVADVGKDFVLHGQERTA